MTKKKRCTVTVKSKPEFQSWDYEVFDEEDFTLFIEKYGLVNADEFPSYLNNAFIRFKDGMLTKDELPSAADEKADLQQIIEAAGELQSRIELFPPRSEPYVYMELREQGRDWHQFRDELIDSLRILRVAAVGASHKLNSDKNPGKPQRNRFINELSDIFTRYAPNYENEIEKVKDRNDFIGTILKAVKIETPTHLNKIINSAKEKRSSLSG
jgi:hypothetical protein